MGLIEKILEAPEKKKFHLKIHIFQKFLPQNQMIFFKNYKKNLHFLAYIYFDAPYAPNFFFTNVKFHIQRTL